MVVEWLGAHAIDMLPRGAPRVDARSVHILLGTALAAIVAVRLQHRWARARRARPVAGERLARIGHTLLYGVLACTVGLGGLNAWVRGDVVFGVLRIPRLATSASLHDDVQRWHALGANLILALAGLHAALALWRHYVLRDGLLRRMGLGV